MGFRSPEQFREVMDRVFALMSRDPELGPRLRAARVPQRFEFPDLALVVNVAHAPEVIAGEHLRWRWSDDVEWQPELELTMDSDVANRYFQGKENPAAALVSRRIRASGDLRKALALAPVTKTVFARYRALLGRDYPELLE